VAKSKRDKQKKPIRQIKTERPNFSSERLNELAAMYWRLILLSLAIGLGIWLLGVSGTRVGINVPPLFFIPTAYVIAIAFILDQGDDRLRAFSFAVLIGFLFLIIVSAIAPYVYQLLGYGAL
jgi:hypothetical protein